MNYEIFATLDKLRLEGHPFVLVTVIESSGSVPGKPGARMAVLADKSLGTVGGGQLEDTALEHARTLLERRAGDLVHYNLSELEMTCGGKATLHYEFVDAARRLFIFGSGHVGAALAAMAPTAGFVTTVFDNRADLSSEGRFPPEVRAVIGPYEEAAKRVTPGAYLVFVTHGHRFDEAALKAVGGPALAAMKYVGVIGSRAKARTMRRNLQDAEITPGDNFFMPIGLGLGGDTPGDIAVSILAELVAAAHDSDGLPHLRHSS